MRRRSTISISFLDFFKNILADLTAKPVFIGIDLGSSYIRVYLEERGVVARERTYVAQSVPTKDFVVFGDEAYGMLGKTPPNLTVFAPIEKGRVSEFDGLVYLLTKLLSHAFAPYRKHSLLNHFNALIGVPLGLTEVEEMAIVEAAKKVGARDVFLAETPLSGGLGLHLPVMENTGTMLVDIGGGKTEVSVMSLGGVVVYKVLKIGGRDFNNALANYVRIRYGLQIGEKTAEEIKLSLGSVLEESGRMLEISGRSVETGMPKTVNVKAHLLYEALYPYFGQLLEALREILEETPPELLKDINQKGIILSGMSAHFADLDVYLTKELGMQVVLEKDAGLSVVRGLGWLIEHKEVMHKIAVHFNRI